MPEHSKSTTNGLRVTKSLGYGIYNLHKQQSYGNTLKYHYERGRAINRFSERRDFEIFHLTISIRIIDMLNNLMSKEVEETTKNKMNIIELSSKNEKW